MIPISKPYIGQEEKQAVLDVLDSGMLVQGPRVEKLEKRFASLCSVRHAIATSSGTTALHIALLANGIRPGDEVITSPFTFIASVNSIIYAGAKPIFVDILPCCLNIDPARIEAAISPKTKAIVPVHLYGYPARMDSIMEIARKHHLAVIEDAAQAVGADFNNQAVGGFGTGCFSLYATKNVMSVEGGIVTTDDDEIARQCRLLRAHGSERRYYHDMLGYNFRMSDLHAAIGLAQMDRLSEFTERRRENAGYLNAHILNPRVVTPGSACLVQGQYSARHVWHQYTIRVVDGDRDEAVKKLNAAGVGTGIFYPVPAHQQRHIHDMGFAPDHSLPVSEQMAREVISLPVHPSLSKDDLDCIVNAVNAL